MGFYKKEIQYFKVGEKVTLASKSRPEFNGDAVVLFATLDFAMFPCPHCKAQLKNSTNVNAYYLSVAVPNECCVPWNKKSIMKKYKAASKSFDGIMKDPSGP